MSTWFCIDHNGRCDAVEVASSTDKTVTLKSGRRKNRLGAQFSGNYFETFDEAKDFALSRQERYVKSLRSNLERANGDLGRIKGMRNPLEDA